MTSKPITIHGFRSTFRTWAAEETTFDNILSKVALSHATGDKVDQAYMRRSLLEKRRALMEAFGAFATTPNVRASEKVVNLRKRRR